MDETDLDLRKIFGVLHRQMRLIIITFLIVVGIVTVVAFALTPSYTSSALVLVDPRSKNLLDPQAELTSAGADSARIDSEVELARSDSVLIRVTEEEDLVSDDEFGVSLGTTARLFALLRLAQPALPTGIDALNETLSNLRGAISVQRRGLTYLISISARSESPEKAANLANAVANAYINEQLASKVNSILASRNILQARIAQARQAIVASEETYDTFIDENIANIAQNPGNAGLASMQARIGQLEQARTRTAALATDVETSLASEDWNTLVASLQSDALETLNQQREDLTRSIAGETDNPAQIDLRNELAQIEDRLRQQATAEISNLRGTVQASQGEEEALRQTIRQEILSSELSTDVLARLYELQQNAELARSQYQTLLSRSQDLEAQVDLQLADSRIASPALPPQSPAFPNKSLILALAGILAAALGVALAFLYENLIGGFASEEQMESVLRVPVASVIPREKQKSEKDSLSDLVVHSPLSVFAESVRRARASIEQALRITRQVKEEGRGNVIMVTSTEPNEGKTTFALSLARTCALAGQSVLLIDCDLRKPSVHRQLNLAPSHGLLEFLTSSDTDITIQSVLSRDEQSGVTAILGARRSDLPTDQLLSGAAFLRLINSARRSFDTVILDTPPIGPVVDGLYISAEADVIAFITRWSHTSQQEALRSITSLAAAKRPEAQIVTILNQQAQVGRSYQRRYSGYYSYSS